MNKDLNISELPCLFCKVCIAFNSGQNLSFDRRQESLERRQGLQSPLRRGKAHYARVEEKYWLTGVNGQSGRKTPGRREAKTPVKESVVAHRLLRSGPMKK